MPLLYLITDRRVLSHRTSEADLRSVQDLIKRALRAGVDMIQIRERDLSARDLLSLVEPAASLANECGARVLANDRADVAAAAGAGVHLTTRSMKPEVVRRAFGAEMLIGVSTHSIEEAEAAERGLADFIVFGPVFETSSKGEYGPPLGLDALRAVTARSRIRVLALGGINLTNFRAALDAGAAGIAGISLFAERENLERIVRTIKSTRLRAD